MEVETKNIEERLNELERKMLWQGSELRNQFGFSNHPDEPRIEGCVEKEINKIKQVIYGGNNTFGLQTKTNIMWKAHFPIWAVATSVITGAVMFLWNKLKGV